MVPLPLELLGALADAHGKPIAELLHSPSHGLLYVRWYGNLTGPEVKHGAEQALLVQADRRYALLLNDKSQATGDWTEAMDWLEYEWLPQAMQGGMQAIAYVFAPDMHNQLSSLEFFERVRQYLPIQVFYDVPTAWQWLRRQGRPSTLLGEQP